MQRGNFQIGDDKNRSTVFQTTYKGSIASENKQQLNDSNNNDNRKHLFGSISLGNH